MSIHYKLFEGSHVNDIVMTFARKEPASQGGLIAQLKETCKELETGIRVAKARKEALEVLISSLEQEEMDKVGEAKESDAHTSSERSNYQDQSSGSSESESERRCYLLRLSCGDGPPVMMTWVLFWMLL